LPREAHIVSIPADETPSGDPVNEVAQRRDRMQATIEGLRRVVELDDTGDGAWREAAVAALSEAAATWERHVAGTEAPQGILADVVEREPRLAHMVDSLRTDHVEVQAIVDRAVAGLGTQDPAGIREELENVAGRLSYHHHLGGEMIHSAYDVELGGDG
jgi:hypothetical protein